MVTVTTIEEPQIEQAEKEESIKTKYWELPVASLDKWRPYTAHIDYRLFLGPRIEGKKHGLSLDRDLVGGIHGPRGSGKSETLSYLVAKKMRAGQPAWTNYPISFYVIEEDGSETYYESMPLDMDKFYAFSSEIRKGVVAITELQYFVESRTSGKEQNRIASYQLMQIRKTALSFLYDVQNPRWIDNRFGWSADFVLNCSDVAKLDYDLGFTGRTLREGEFIHWKLRDISGILTGKPYSDEFPIEYGPYQFPGSKWWDIYPTHFIVDVYEAVHGIKKKEDKQEAISAALELAIQFFLNKGEQEVASKDVWDKASELGSVIVPPNLGGQILASFGITKKYKSYTGKYYYNLGILLDGEN